MFYIWRKIGFSIDFESVGIRLLLVCFVVLVRLLGGFCSIFAALSMSFLCSNSFSYGKSIFRHKHTKRCIRNCVLIVPTKLPFQQIETRRVHIIRISNRTTVEFNVSALRRKRKKGHRLNGFLSFNGTQIATKYTDILPEHWWWWDEFVSLLQQIT